MKFLLCAFCILSVSQASFGAQYLELAVETNGIRVEYIESSNRGLVHIKGCSQCEKKYYTFTKKPIIKKQGKIISFDEFLTDYWNAKFPTLFLDPKSLSVLRINY